MSVKREYLLKKVDRSKAIVLIDTGKNTASEHVANDLDFICYNEIDSVPFGYCGVKTDKETNYVMFDIESTDDFTEFELYQARRSGMMRSMFQVLDAMDFRRNLKKVDKASLKELCSPDTKLRFATNPSISLHGIK